MRELKRCRKTESDTRGMEAELEVTKKIKEASDALSEAIRICKETDAFEMSFDMVIKSEDRLKKINESLNELKKMGFNW